MPSAIRSGYDDTFNTERTVSAAAAYTTSSRWLPTQGCCKHVVHLPRHADGTKNAYASEGNL
jgi:hypothetical protein